MQHELYERIHTKRVTVQHLQLLFATSVTYTRKRTPANLYLIIDEGVYRGWTAIVFVSGTKTRRRRDTTCCGRCCSFFHLFHLTPFFHEEENSQEDWKYVTSHFRSRTNHVGAIYVRCISLRTMVYLIDRVELKGDACDKMTLSAFIRGTHYRHLT